MIKSLTAIYQKQGKWYLGWVEEIPGVNTQGKTLAECRENLKEALSLVVETQRLMTKKELAGRKTVREPIALHETS